MLTLAIDIGGTHIKASVLDDDGRMTREELKADTPREATPDRLVDGIGALARRLGSYDRVSVGFPGVVRNGVIRTAHNLGTPRFAGFDLAHALSNALAAPVRVANDADVQGLGCIAGHGLEVVITLGTGFGSSLFEDGRLGPHLEFAHHNFRHDRTYEDELGDAALKRVGTEEWNRNLAAALEALRGLTTFDHLYIGGGNARCVTLELPADVSVVSNVAGITGGVRLWTAPQHPIGAS